MKKFQPIQAALVCMSLLSVFAVQAETMSKPDYKAGKTRINEVYKADKAACKSLSGNAKNVCVQEAKAAEQKALADAKMDKDISKAKKTDASEKMEADYKVAIEKCDALASEAKTGCVNSARARFGKN